MEVALFLVPCFLVAFFPSTTAIDANDIAGADLMHSMLSDALTRKEIEEYLYRMADEEEDQDKTVGANRLVDEEQVVNKVFDQYFTAIDDEKEFLETDDDDDDSVPELLSDTLNEDYEGNESNEEESDLQEVLNRLFNNNIDDSGMEKMYSDGEKEPENVNDNIGGTIQGDKPGEYVSDGDILFGPGEEKEVFGGGTDDSERSQQAADATVYKHKRWPMPVPYVIEKSLGSKGRGAISKAFSEYRAKTCIRFVKRTTQKNYISFFKGTGCWSSVGMKGGMQRISLGKGCEYKNTAIHEIMHALGFWHEQSRPDRDNYVTINLQNVESDKKKHNFQKKLAKDVTYLGHPYDYHSTMHYGKTAFGKKFTYIKNGKKFTGRKETITPKIKTTLGQCYKCGMSKIDAAQLNAMYCKDNKLVTFIKKTMKKYKSQKNSKFRYTLLNLLKARYSKYYWTVSSYAPVYGASKHSFRGYCAHVYRYYNRNVVACYALKTARIPSNKKVIVNAAVRAAAAKGCHASTARKVAWNIATSYGYPIAMVQNVRYGSDLNVAWHAHTIMQNYVCSRTCKTSGWWISKKKTCTNHHSSLIVMFGKP